MAANYHSSDSLVNTHEIHGGDLLPDMVETMGSRLKAAREALGMSQQQLANRSSVSQGTIGNVESDARGYGRSVVAIARALGVSTEYLLMHSDDKGQVRGVTSPEESGFVPVRRVLFKLSAGVSGFTVDFLDNGDGEPLFFRADWFRKRGYSPDKCYAMPISGASMEPELRAGDVVVVNTGASDPEDGQVFAVNYEGEPVIKRLVRDAGQWWLASDNPDQRRYPRKLCDDRVILIGRVVHKQSEHI